MKIARSKPQNANNEIEMNERIFLLFLFVHKPNKQIAIGQSSGKRWRKISNFHLKIISMVGGEISWKKCIKCKFIMQAI
jgi:hypothetical protein